MFRSTHEPHSSGVPFGIRIENVLKRGGGGGAFIQGRSRGCLRTNSLINQPCHATNGSVSENDRLTMAGLDLLGGSWNRSTQGKGCNRSHSAGFPRKRANDIGKEPGGTCGKHCAPLQGLIYSNSRVHGYRRLGVNGRDHRQHDLKSKILSTQCVVGNVLEGASCYFKAGDTLSYPLLKSLLLMRDSSFLYFELKMALCK